VNTPHTASQTLVEMFTSFPSMLQIAKQIRIVVMQQNTENYSLFKKKKKKKSRRHLKI
jgi:hypothetical protein